MTKKKIEASVLSEYYNQLFGDYIKKTMIEEGKKLEKIAKNVWQDYLNSYQPQQYIRTGKTLAGIKLIPDVVIASVNPFRYGIRVTFENDLMYHDSVISENQPQGHSLMLISNGWHAKKLEERFGKAIYRFTYYEGFDYIDKVIKEYEKVKSPIIDELVVEWSSRYLR